MRYMTWILALVLMVATDTGAQETVVASRVVSAGLFKNGLAVVECEVKVSGAGTYLVSDVPDPVHGTFWIESVDDVQVRVTMRDMDVEPRANTAIDFQEQLANKEVTVHFREPGVPPTTGTVISTEPPLGASAWNRQYQQTHYNTYRLGNPAAGPGRFLILETQDGREYVDTSMIARVTVSAPAKRITERNPVLLLTVTNREPSTIRMSYLAKGLSWAPSYRLDISGEKELTIEQKAIIKNELGAFHDAEIFLISGFPSVQFGHVTSPLSLQQTWATFFQQLNMQIRPGHGGMGQILQQQAITLNTIDPGRADLSAAPSGEGPDIHYQPAGKLTMAEGDSIMLRIASAKTSYDRIVEWIVPDTRKANGRYIQEHERNQNPDQYQDAAWDALRFANPFSFPMTTGAAMIISKGRFMGERTSFWVNPDEESILHITKALSIRTRTTEQEEPDTRKVVYIAGDDYHQTTVKGELTMNNHRKEKVVMAIRRQFSGDLLDSVGDPTCVLREEGAWSVNKRNELTWSLELEPGEERTLTYRYTVLVNR
jgi:hypothetical protein